MKLCKKCNTEKPFSEFHKMARNKLGVQSKCKQCASSIARASYADDPKAFNAKAMAWAARNPQQALAIGRKWYAANTEKVAAKCKAWRSANPESSAAYSRTRRSRKASAEGFHTADDVADIFGRQRGKCASCKKKLFDSGEHKFHVDHITPLALGGSNWPSNLQCLCPGCNLSKHAKDPMEWAKQNGMLL